MNPSKTRIADGSDKKAISVIVMQQMAMVVMTTRRIPKLLIKREVNGPNEAWPTLMAASTVPAIA